MENNIMKKILMTLFFFTFLSACKPLNEPYNADIDDMDPYCEDGLVYHDGNCVDPNPVTDDTEGRTIMKTLRDALTTNEDFINTWFEEEKDYYSQFFSTSTTYHINKEDVISYNVEDLIFHEGSIRADRIREGLTTLLMEELLVPEQQYNSDIGTLSYHLEDGTLHVTIDNPVESRYGWYRLRFVDNKLWFDTLERSQDSPFEGIATNYIQYDQDQQYFERTVVTDGTNHHYFQYDYAFDSNTVTTILVTAMPSYDFYDIGRAERHFDDNYYIVYSAGTSYAHKYFTLFHDHHASINVSDMSVIVGDDTVNMVQLQWNLLDITDWDYIENDRVYTENASYPITPFTYLEFPYFGPEFTLYEDYDRFITNDDLGTPHDVFTYDIYTMNDCQIPRQQLDLLANQFSVTTDSYTIFNETYLFKDGFDSYLDEVIPTSYLNDFITHAE
jgi:hypothetical protein